MLQDGFEVVGGCMVSCFTVRVENRYKMVSSPLLALTRCNDERNMQIVCQRESLCTAITTERLAKRTACGLAVSSLLTKPRPLVAENPIFGDSNTQGLAMQDRDGRSRLCRCPVAAS